MTDMIIQSINLYYLTKANKKMSSTTSFRMDDDLDGKLDGIAQKLRRSKSWIINDALRLYIEQEERKLEMLQQTEEAIADIEAGRIVSGEDVMKWLDTWGTEQEKAAPPSPQA